PCVCKYNGEHQHPPGPQAGHSYLVTSAACHASPPNLAGEAQRGVEIVERASTRSACAQRMLPAISSSIRKGRTWSPVAALAIHIAYGVDGYRHPLFSQH